MLTIDHTRQEAKNTKKLELHLTNEIEYLFHTVSFTRDFHLGKNTNKSYYIRHLVEAILRIRMNNEVDSYCLYKVVNKKPFVANIIIQYLSEEYGHEKLLIADLERFGVSKEEVLNTKHFFSTELLINYLYSSIDKDGALPDLLWNWFVEWYSAKYNKQITIKAQQKFGVDKVQKSLYHLQIDDELDHANNLLTAIEYLIEEDGNLNKAKEYLSNFIKLISMYFEELYQETIINKNHKV